MVVKEEGFLEHKTRLTDQQWKSISFFITDLFVDILYWQEMGEMQYVVHHIFVKAACSYVLVSTTLHIPGCP